MRKQKLSLVTQAFLAGSSTSKPHYFFKDGRWNATSRYLPHIVKCMNLDKTHNRSNNFGGML